MKIERATKRKNIKVQIITPITISFSEPLTDKEYKIELKAVMKEIELGAREWAYGAILTEGKSKLKT